MARRNARQPTEAKPKRKHTPTLFDEAQAAYRKIARLNTKITAIRGGLSWRALVLLDLVMEQAEGEDVEAE